MESYVDFFYITNNCLYDFLSGKFLTYEKNSRSDHMFDSSEDNLNNLMTRLIRAEEVCNLFRIADTPINNPHLKNT